MAIKQKNEACQQMCEAYLLLNETKRNNFARLTNKLLIDNFIYAAKEDDRNDYYDILSMRTLIENYFSLMDYELIHVDTYKIFYIRTLANRNRLRLKKLETVLLIIFRLLYYKGSLNINASSDISVSFASLISEVNQTGIFKNQISFSEYYEALRTMKRYKLIDFDFKDYKDDNIIMIYPTLLYVIKVEDIKMLTDKLNSYRQIQEEEDETEQD